MEKVFFLLELILSNLLLVVKSLDNSVGLKPPLGFNTWERYRCIVDCVNYPEECISERLIKTLADEMSSELLSFGYEYLVIDDCWLAETRDVDGNLQENRTRFPNGMKDLVNYVHSKGLKFGIYGNFGEKTCAGYPGIKDDLERDAYLFASWEVDFVKLDGCFSDAKEKELGYPEFGRLLNSTGRAIMYSCSWPAYSNFELRATNYTQLTEICNLWRNYNDVEDSWESVSEIINWFGNHGGYLSRFHGPGHWHDPDMIIVGNFGLSFDQAQTQMAIWCILGAPLFLSTDLLRLQPEHKAIILNPIALAINQDSLGKLGRRISRINGIQVWRKAIQPEDRSYSSYAVVFYNSRTDGYPRIVERTMEQLGLYYPNGYEGVDVFNEHSAVFTTKSSIKVKVNPTGVSFWRFSINIPSSRCEG